MDETQNQPSGQPPAHKKRRWREKGKLKPRFRFTFIWIIGLIVLLGSLATDPDTGLIRSLPFGAGTVATFVIMTRAIWYISLLHFARKGLMDYFDLEEAWEICKNDPKAAGLYSIGAGLYTIGMAIAIWAAVTH